MKILLLLLAFSFLFLGCANREEAPMQQNQTRNQAQEIQERDIGNLFQIDTDKPLDGSGYEVPAAGEAG